MSENNTYIAEPQGFSVVVQLHQQPPINTKALRPIISREFLPGMRLDEVWEWVEMNSMGFDVESAQLRGLGKPLL